MVRHDGYPVIASDSKKWDSDPLYAGKKKLF